MATYYVSTTGSDGNDGLTIGTAKATVQAGANLLTAGDTLEIIAGTYVVTSTITFPAGVSSTSLVTTVRGYDGARPIIQGGASAISDLLNLNRAGLYLESVEIDGNYPTFGATISGVNISVASVVGMRNCIVRRCSHAGITLGQFSRVTACEVTEVAVNNAITTNSGGYIEGCYIHGGGSNGISLSANGSPNIAIGNVIVGGSGFGIVGFNNQVIRGNTIIGKTSDGLRFSFGVTDMSTIIAQNNLVVACGGYGIRTFSSHATKANPTVDYNAYYGNTSGPYGGNVQAGSSDVLLTADPFIDRAGGDYSLTSAAKQLLLSGTPQSWLGLTTTVDSSRVIGAWQPAASAARRVLSSPHLIGSLG